MNLIETKAPAKINIGLYILSKREDNFHNLLTLFYPIHDLCDTLVFEKSDKFTFSCNIPNLPNDSRNIVVKAKQLLEETFDKELKVNINLIKKIPSQAGLGGGSSDAAATLKSLNKLFNLRLGEVKLAKLAQQLGSDVPFFIKSKPAIGKSRGEILDEVELKIIKPILIVFPYINIPTKDAFQNIIPHETNFDYQSIIVNKKLRYDIMREIISNDFERYVYDKYPEIKWIKDFLYSNGALFSSLSGSGSSVFGIFESFEDAKKTSSGLPSNYFKFIGNLGK